MATATLMGQGVIGLREDDVVFSAAKLSFSYGLGNAVSFPMSVGASAFLLPDRPTPQAVLATLRRHRPTIFYGVPSLYAPCSHIPRSAPARAPTACVSAFRRARRCPRISANAGARW
jgi:acyl-coenzyme A synthetase/AMP-(fatty) acid ligase